MSLISTGRARIWSAKLGISELCDPISESYVRKQEDRTLKAERYVGHLRFVFPEVPFQGYRDGIAKDDGGFKVKISP